MDRGRYTDLASRFSTVESLDTLAEALGAEAGRLGFEFFVYALEVPSGPPEARLALVNGYPEPWIERYFEQGFLALDPVMATVRGTVLPFDWDSLVGRRGRVLEEAGDFGLRRGLSAPLHGPRLELGVLSFATAAPRDAADTDVRKALAEAPLLAAFVHETLGRVLRRKGDGPRALTARERDCLLWVGEGKTSWEIGLILGTSERTVNFHLANAAKKLGVSGRRHAIARALLLGLL